ncbi:putative inositol-1-monophosphatase [Lyophyllum shimeji]|uniref:Inositol-1-monophosphatase n=1 Tax=Lyophyllum shimeji TaxID=47721 RepID=A0A9P3PYI3_LYOSH|nr:putative inositol-1-monophosphatase [Lyophyllum shimeji]
MAVPELTATDLQSILKFTEQLARTAGKLILEGSKAIQSAPDSQADIGEKKNAVDLVTEYDVRVEELVKSTIKEKYPDFQFVGEESYAAGSRNPLTDEPTFCVDPIDGTTNFVHGFPFVCISLGLIYKRRPVLGVIYNPFLDHLYTGIKGQGSFLTRGASAPVKLPLSSPKPLPSLSQAIIAVEWGADRTASTIDSKSRSFGRLAGDPEQGVAGGKMAHSLRSMGCAALNFAMVAQGGLDVYWEIGCWPWDVSAGIVIAEEAGGLVSGAHAAFEATASSDAFGDVTEEILTGRKYVVVRAIAGNPGETGKDAQKRIIKELYDTVEDVPAN